jgi:hypothetical protein
VTQQANIYRRGVVASLFRPRFRGGGVCAVAVLGLLALSSVAASSGCTTVDPGQTFVVSDVSFDANYFYCHVEPEFIFAKSCGSGDPSKGDAPNGCHFTASVVSGMVLLDHPAVDCGGGDAPVDTTQIGMGSAAQSNFEAVSLEMEKSDYLSSPLFVRPSGTYHPRPIFDPNDQQVRTLLMTWANK